MVRNSEQNPGEVSERIKKRQQADAKLLEMFAIDELPKQRMSAEEQQEFGQRIVLGDEGAKQEYILRRLRFAMMIAMSETEVQFASSSLTLEDHFQNIIEAMQRRLDEYQLHGGENFREYMSWSYRQAEREYKGTADLTRLPSHIHEKLAKREKLEKRLNRTPSSIEVASLLAITEREAALLEQVVEHRQHGTLPLAMAEQVPDPDVSISDELILAIQEAQLRQAVVMLPVREKKVLELRFGLTGEQPMTQKEVGKRFNVSHSIISRIEIRALKKLKDLMQDFRF